MKILTLQGGARKKGNTATILDWVVSELTSIGHEITSVTLHDKTIKGCLACGQCKKEADKINCIQEDDTWPILDEMVAADLVIFTSPLYFWGFSGPLKSFIDRTYSLYTGYHQPEHASLVDGQRQALLMTGGGPYENNAEPVFEAFRKLQAPHKAINAGELYIGSCTAPENLDSEAKKQAIAFAHKIVS